MEQNELLGVTDKELLEQAKKIRSAKKLNAGLIGMLIGIAVYSVVRNGLGFLPFILVISAVVLVTKGKKQKEVEVRVQQEISKRGLK